MLYLQVMRLSEYQDRIGAPSRIACGEPDQNSLRWIPSHGSGRGASFRPEAIDSSPDSTLNLLCDLGQIAVCLWASVPSSVEMVDWGEMFKWHLSIMWSLAALCMHHSLYSTKTGGCLHSSEVQHQVPADLKGKKVITCRDEVWNVPKRGFWH